MNEQEVPPAPPPTMPPVQYNVAVQGGCQGCRGQATINAEQATANAKKTLGIVSFLTAKAGKKVPEHVRKLRLAVCHTCTETETGNKVRLFRKIDGKEFCGAPRLSDLTKVYRNEFDIGCGCVLDDKTRYEAAICPRKKWGPGALMGNQFRVQVRTTRILKDVIDVQVHYAKNPHEESDMTGIGDTLAALPIVHALQRKYPNKQVRMRCISSRTNWARAGWANVVTIDDWSTRGEWWAYLNPDKLLELDRNALAHQPPVSRHHIWAAAVGVDEPIRDIGLAPTKEAEEWGRGQLVGNEVNGKPVVCLVPYSNAAQRTWPLHHWIDLAEMLTREGCFVYVMDGNQEGRTKYMPYLRYWGWGPAHSIALFKKTHLVIGNDSGMTHLAGVMRIPALAICSITLGSVVFGWYDTVRVIQSEAKCSGCLWDVGRGYRQACNFDCEAMWDIRPRTVLGHAMDILKGGQKP